jgi:hypothetical protein
VSPLRCSSVNSHDQRIRLQATITGSAGFGWENAIDLWAYSADEESSDWELDWQIAYVSDWRCGVTIDAGDYVDIHPQAGWLGSCDVPIRVSDSLKTADDTFWVNVVPVRARVFLPLVLKNSP